jgi:hypothetical protein
MLTLHPQVMGNQVSVPRSEWERLMALARQVEHIRVDPAGPAGMGILRPEEHGLHFAAPAPAESYPRAPNFYERWAARAVRPRRSNLWVWLFAGAVFMMLGGVMAGVAWSDAVNPPPPEFRLSTPPQPGEFQWDQN